LDEQAVQASKKAVAARITHVLILHRVAVPTGALPPVHLLEVHPAAVPPVHGAAAAAALIVEAEAAAAVTREGNFYSSYVPGIFKSCFENGILYIINGKIMKTKMLFLTFILTFFSGCYTVLQHPDIENVDENGTVLYGEISYNDDCSKCHESKYGDYTYDHDRYIDYYNQEYYLTNGNNYDSRNNWIGYYNVPWWYTPSVAQASQVLGSGKSSNDNTTTSSKTDVRTTGSNRSSVNISLPSVSRTTTSSGSGSTTSNNDSNNSGRSTSRTSTTSTTSSGSSSGSTNRDSSGSNTTSTTSTNRGNQNTTQSGNSSNDNKRNSGSTRRK
jgi:hypothetical protein